TVVTALHRTDLEVQEGEVLLIIGPSGSGKTTLLSLLGCVIYPTEGTVVVDGRELNRLNDRELAALRLKVIGFVFQTYNLISPLTAEENVAFPLLLDGRISRKEALGRAREALAKVNLSAKCRSLPRQLSSGEQQRTAIARALVTDPPILLCDEPTAALDEVSFDRVMLELQALARQGKAVVIVTHDPRLKPYADRVITVVGGRVLAAQKDTNE
ncbi:MAG: ABC transporter ATP-binding protein, partial [Saprospiraceae bacterium]|nr:ABC transporter ATP-binding protein [Saprospiraceae bacterium]